MASTLATTEADVGIIECPIISTRASLVEILSFVTLALDLLIHRYGILSVIFFNRGDSGSFGPRYNTRPFVPA